ncbi:uncharacterized protein LOC113365542 [Ctenocephalides felis]|uniref:uncharacterized protein LOC113365542 n=1 Tax=Ctenocephalides felis TaxID=7515 RepID=UPI000E6E1573|nr:uncharacterized protein LOC113365542 [Ctenocephalides felis]
MNGGFYMHFGVEEGILNSMEKHFFECPEKIHLQLNCDGMAISKSSNSSFWPILLMSDINEKVEPFIVGIHHGNSKPADANIYLSQFPSSSIHNLVKGHAGYFSCPKCIQEGDFEKHVILTEIDAILRTDESFRSKQQPEHHTGLSILEDLGIGMVSQVALDYYAHDELNHLVNSMEYVLKRQTESLTNMMEKQTEALQCIADQ